MPLVSSFASVAAASPAVMNAVQNAPRKASLLAPTIENAVRLVKNANAAFAPILFQFTSNHLSYSGYFLLDLRELRL